MRQEDATTATIWKTGVNFQNYLNEMQLNAFKSLEKAIYPKSYQDKRVLSKTLKSLHFKQNNVSNTRTNFTSR